MSNNKCYINGIQCKGKAIYTSGSMYVCSLWIRCAIATFWLPTFFSHRPLDLSTAPGGFSTAHFGNHCSNPLRVTWPLSLKRKVEKLVLINYVAYFIWFHLLMPFKGGRGVRFTCFACWFRTRHLVFFVAIKATNFLSWGKKRPKIWYMFSFRYKAQIDEIKCPISLYQSYPGSSMHIFSLRWYLPVNFAIARVAPPFGNCDIIKHLPLFFKFALRLDFNNFKIETY